MDRDLREKLWGAASVRVARLRKEDRTAAVRERVYVFRLFILAVK